MRDNLIVFHTMLKAMLLSLFIIVLAHHLKLYFSKWGPWFNSLWGFENKFETGILGNTTKIRISGDESQECEFL